MKHFIGHLIIWLRKRNEKQRGEIRDLMREIESLEKEVKSIEED